MRRALVAALLLAAGAAAARPIERLEIEGNLALPSALFERLAAPWLGRELDEAEIEALRQHLSRAYVERGYINSGLLLLSGAPPGSLRLRAIEGRLVAVRIAGLDGLNPEHLRARLQRPGDGILDIERLRERIQLLLDDPLIERLQARLRPGDAPGEARLELELQRARAWELQLFANNQRPVSVGEAALGLRGVWRNALGQGDSLELQLQGPARGGQDAQTRLGAHLPLTALGLPWTSLSLGDERSHAVVVEQPAAQLDIQSRLRSREFGISHIAFESLGASLAGGLQGQSRRQVSSLLGEPFSFTPGLADGHLRERLLRLWLEAQWRRPGRALAARLAYQKGRSNVDAAAPGAPPPRFDYWTLQAQWRQRLNEDGLQWGLRLAAQHSDKRLLALDGFGVGGLHTVRGHLENRLLRDLGQQASLELDWPLPLAAPWRLTLQAFIDQARARNQDEAWQTLSSAGLGLSLGWRGAWARGLLDLAWARPLSGRLRGGSSLQAQGLHLQLSLRF